MTMTLLESSLSTRARRYFLELPGAGVLPPAPGVQSGEAGSQDSGTQVRFQVATAAGVVTAARFQAYGCPHTLAVCAWLTEQLPGQRVAAIGAPADWAREMSVPLEKLGRLLVVEDALNATLGRARSE